MYVCECARVRERELRAAIRAGADTVAGVGATCGAGLRCGLCLERITALVAKMARRSLPASASQRAVATDGGPSSAC